MEKRLILFLILSAAIFWGYAYVYGKLYPPPPTTPQEQIATASPSPTPELTATPATQNPVEAAPIASATQAEFRWIKVKTDHWVATLTNQGGVIHDWTMTSFTDGKPIDPPNGVNLISAQLSKDIGAPFRFHIPSDQALETELNNARYEVVNTPDAELFINKGERREITFRYANNGVEATKTLIFKGVGFESSSGFDFDFQTSVRRNGNPVDAYVVIGPNFGDQAVNRHDSVYKHAPQLTYEDGESGIFTGSVERETADSLKSAPVHPNPGPVMWAAVDDNYFAMAIVPPRPVAASRLFNKNYVSMAIKPEPDAVNHVYAGPKDLNMLAQVSGQFGLSQRGFTLVDIVSYGWLNFIRGLLKPIAQFMLTALRAINNVTHNFGWSIVILTVVLNMFFFPLRWRSSVAMKRTASMQPKMKELQERMKKIDKNDPRMADLNKEQMALMKDMNPLMGCLPLLLQMPFFMAVFAILTVSIEVRNAPFFGWLQDLSSPDPYWILPILMCVTMIAQTALTPTTADPIQKRVQYIMPPMLTYFFFVSAPAGLVLYWMVSNLVGVAQQFVINRLNPPAKPPATSPSPTDKAEQRPAKGKKAKAALAKS